MSNNFANFDAESFELKSSSTVYEWGKILVFAPHPDDESLGCGGAIALARKFDQPVSVVTVSDGTLSHPNSKKFPPAALRDLRETEMKNALDILGVAEDKISFLRYADRAVPDENAGEFNSAVNCIISIFNAEKPQTVFVPWRRDPHPDHRATWQIVRAAAARFNSQIRIIEYPIWLWELAEENDFPQTEKITAWRLDVSGVLAIKQQAIFAHVSQTTDLIDDDPQGFRLSPEVLSHFAVPYEVFLEEIK